MPTYQYRCTSCNNEYEMREGFDAPARQSCPRCGAMAKRVIFPPPIVFKGSGFYVTDSRKGSNASIGMDGLGTGAVPPTPAKDATGSETSAPAASASTSTGDSASKD